MVAERLSITQNRLSRFESGTRPRLDRLERYARAVGGELRVYIVTPHEQYELVFPGKLDGDRRMSGITGYMISQTRPFRRSWRSCQDRYSSRFWWKSKRVGSSRKRTRHQWRPLVRRTRDDDE